MSVVTQNLAYVNQWFQQAAGTVINDPYVAQFNQVLPGVIQNQAYPEVLAILKGFYDGNPASWNPSEAQGAVYQIVQGVVFMYLHQTYNYQAQSFAPGYNFWLNCRQQLQSAMQPQVAMQPQQVSYYSNPPAYNPAPAYYGSPTPNMHGNVMQGSSFVNNTPTYGGVNNNMPTGLQINMKGNNNMNQQDHMPAQQNQSFTNFVTEPIPVPSDSRTNVPVQVAVGNKFTRINLIDKKDTCITNETVSVVAKIFIAFEEALAKPMLFETEESRFFPSINTSDQLTQSLLDTFGMHTMEDIFDRLMIISRQYSIPGVMAWLDHRISHTVEMAIEHRYGKKGVVIPNYREERSDIDAYLGSMGHGVVEDIHKLVLKTIKAMVDGLVSEQCLTCEKEIDTISVSSLDYIVSIPWVINYNRKNEDKQVFIDGVSKEQLFDIFDQAWEAIGEEDRFSIVLTDLSSARYRVYRKGTVRHDSGAYYLERMGF